MLEAIKTKYHEILISIDSLFDTRLALLNRMDDSFNDEYLTCVHRRRTSDSFWVASQRFDKTAWTKAWETRDVSLLKNSMKTNMYSLLSALICSIEWGVKIAAKDRITRLTINTYPYILSNHDKQMLKDTIEKYEFITLRVVVEFTHHASYNPLKQPSVLRYSTIIHHSMEELFTTSFKDIDEFNFGNITLIVPKLLTDYQGHKNISDPQVKEKLNNLLTPPKGSDMEIFTAMEHEMRTLVQLRYVGIFDFTAYLPDNVDDIANTIQEFSAKIVT